MPVYLQTEAAECGLACLAMIASFHRYRVDLHLAAELPFCLRAAAV